MAGKRKGSIVARFTVTAETRKIMDRIAKETGLPLNQVQSFCMGYGAAVLHAGLVSVKPTMRMQEAILSQMFPGLAESVRAITAETTAK
jgi:hypothetical protein